MKRILLSLLVVGAVGGTAFFATNAFFSDTETSTGNSFVAGAIDLLIDNTSYYTNNAGVLVASPTTSWTLSDLTAQKFFNFTDLKPGDIGEDTISVHVNNNDAWLCAAARVNVNSDETCTEPESSDDPTCAVEVNGQNGELAQAVNFAFWKDDGDNVFESNETVFLGGPISGLNGAGQIALADTSANSVFGTGVPVPGGETVFIGKAWCFGTLTPAPMTQDNVATGDPITLGTTGFVCNGALVNNAAQTDKVVGDLQFYAVQSRNNAQFTCAGNYTPTWGQEVQRPFIGALLSSYSTPNCSVTVDPGNSIQSAIDSATAGQTICLANGVHNSDAYPLRVNEDNLTIAGVSVSGATLSGGVILDNDGTKVTGINIGGSNLLGEIFGVYVNTGVDNAEVSFNSIIGLNVASSRGIINATGTTTNAIYKHNVVNNWNTGIFLNPSTGMLVDYNTVTSNIVGIGNDNPTNNTLSHNVIKGNSLEGIGALLNGAESLTVNLNNLYSNGASDDLNSYGATSVLAENNWWGDLTPADNVTGPVDFTPFEASAFAEN